MAVYCVVCGEKIKGGGVSAPAGVALSHPRCRVKVIGQETGPEQEVIGQETGPEQEAETGPEQPTEVTKPARRKKKSDVTAVPEAAESSE
jgi:hypothetical protein